MADRSTSGRASRRRFVQATGVAGILGLAGCAAPIREPIATSNADGSEQTSTDGGDETEETEEPNGPANPAETDYPYTGVPTIVDLNEQGAETTMRVVPSRHTLVSEAAGGPLELPEVWAWQADDNDPSVPGPILRVEEGTEFDVHLENTEDVRPHTFHVHALKKDWMDDGAPASTGIQVGADESHTYGLTANVPGTHLYHCHYQTQNHLDLGMYGIVRVDPVDYELPDKEFFMTVKEWDSRLSNKFAGGNTEYSHRDRRPDVFTINGRSAPYTFHPEEGSPFVVKEGDRVRIHVTNNGYESHSIHLHNHRFEVVEKDGGVIPPAARHEEDVTSLAPAERKTIEFTADADPGIYLVHCHKVHHVMNGENYPGGMLTAIVYESAMDTPQFADAMDKAGYEG
ncbi:multicopper oxidase domain-containing protein [Halalkalirubrum salinum]|uniref:multicopper oxidase domain-containing protein n=1 Tax=Halalkalirubrum salinum TaxID=2563889 RepID=UPI0010FB0A79|nr:multicopper oxidase domain-containing protein [Halalkalirubrum salinum]